jgi:predicted acyl esterase
VFGTEFWWENAVEKNQYGKLGRVAKNWGLDTLDGDLDDATLLKNRRNLMLDTASLRFRDEEYYASRNFDVENIEVPLLSVANWVCCISNVKYSRVADFKFEGGILLHLRGNVLGWMRASSPYKYLHFIIGRHDLPCYYDHPAELQQSFFDAFLKDNYYDGWKTGKQPRVKLCLRRGDCGVDDPERELAFPIRAEADWPIPDTKRTKFFLRANSALLEAPSDNRISVSYDALNGDAVQFRFTTPKTLEITGHILAHLVVSASKDKDEQSPTDIDLFITLRKLAKEGSEVFYTGTMGDAVPIVKGWQRISLRKTHPSHPLHRPYLQYRNYIPSDVQDVEIDKPYDVDVEIWPTNVVLEEGETLVLEVAGHDTQGVLNFSHGHVDDRRPEVLRGQNNLHVGGEDSWLLLPVIPNRL